MKKKLQNHSKVQIVALDSKLEFAPIVARILISYYSLNMV
jgi:hypothetical protein